LYVRRIVGRSGWRSVVILCPASVHLGRGSFACTTWGPAQAARGVSLPRLPHLGQEIDRILQEPNNLIPAAAPESHLHEEVGRLVAAPAGGPLSSPRPGRVQFLVQRPHEIRVARHRLPLTFCCIWHQVSHASTKAAADTGFSKNCLL